MNGNLSYGRISLPDLHAAVSGAVQGPRRIRPQKEMDS